MNQAELQNRLRTILDVETAEPVDWARVQELSADLLRQILQSPEIEPPHFVYHYLADADIRERDLEYADIQRAELREIVG